MSLARSRRSSAWASSRTTADRPTARRVRVIRALSRSLRHLVVAFGRAVLIEAGLRLTTLPRLASWLGVPLDTRRRGGSPPPEVTPERLTMSQQARLAAIGVVYRYWPFGDTCLRRALAAGHTLRVHRPVLRIGVTRTGGAVRAHAWIEFDGVSFGSDPAVGYSALSTRS